MTITGNELFLILILMVFIIFVVTWFATWTFRARISALEKTADAQYAFNEQVLQFMKLTRQRHNQNFNSADDLLEVWEAMDNE